MMQKIQSREEYVNIIDENKKAYKKLVTNCYMHVEEAEKYIAQDRLYFETVDGGLFLYVDEALYYLGYYYLAPDAGPEISAKDKDVVIKNIYAEGRKKDAVLRVEELLQQNGFVLADTMRQISADPETVLKNLERPGKVAKRILDSSGFRLVSAAPDRLEEIREWQNHMDCIPYYQVDYFTDEELLEEIDAGRLVCMVDATGKICAVRHVFVRGKSMYGWVSIGEAYRKRYGMVLVFSVYTLEYALKHGLKVMGWITTTNQPSIQYHMKIGYQWENRYTDEWLLPKL